MTDLPAIRTENLTKRFGAKTAVDSLNLEVRKGELFGLVGPDGAGKTTTMRLLTAIMDPSGGDAWVAGLSIRREGEEVKERIGYMSQRFGLYEDLTVMENLDFYADLFEVPKRERPERTERLLGFSNLTLFKDRLAGNLSGGMKQKLGLACALIHTPEVLFLDEPTCGVDPVSRRDFWKILYDLLREEITVFVSTAYLDEAERCTRVALIHEGRILLVDTPSAIKKRLAVPMWEISLPRARYAGLLVGAVPGVRSVSVYGDRLHVALEEGASIDSMLSGLKNGGMEVEGFRQITPSLEDVFIGMVRERETENRREKP
jgi:ABC-2 type transport system ATP-binding protein